MVQRMTKQPSSNKRRYKAFVVVIDGVFRKEWLSWYWSPHAAQRCWRRIHGHASCSQSTRCMSGHSRCIGLRQRLHGVDRILCTGSLWHQETERHERFITNTSIILTGTQYRIQRSEQHLINIQQINTFIKKAFSFTKWAIRCFH